jgi:hypothetical protein
MDHSLGIVLGFGHQDFGWLVAVDPHAFALAGVDQDLGAAGRYAEQAIRGYDLKPGY